MDLYEEWNYTTFLDAGEYGFGLSALPLEPLKDCPKLQFSWMCLFAAQDGKLMKMPNTFCIFERHVGDIMWRHAEDQIPNKLVSDLCKSDWCVYVYS